MKRIFVAIMVVLTLCGCENDSQNASIPETNSAGITESVSSGINETTEPAENVTTEPVVDETTEPNTTPVSEFEYEMVNGEVIITGYKGVARDIYIPAEINERPVTQIGEKAFTQYDLVSIEIPDSVVIIGENAFASCKCLESVRLPDSNLRIGMGAFFDCDALTQIELPDNLEYLGSGAFSYCDNLEYLRLPEQFSGFDIMYQAWSEKQDNGEILLMSGEKIKSPVNGDMTLLVVGWESEAHKLIREYGYDDIGYIADYAIAETDYEVQEGRCWEVESYTILDSAGDTIQTVTYRYNDKGVLIEVEYDYMGSITTKKYTLDARGYPNKVVYMENGVKVGEATIECDEQGNIIREEQRDNGVVTATTQNSYSNQGILQKSVQEYYYTDGSIRYVITIEYNENGYPTYMLWDYGDMYQKYAYTYQYDDNRNLCMETCHSELGTSGEIIEESQTYTRIVCDDSGHIVLAADVDENGWDQDVYQIYEYDKYGNLVKITAYQDGEVSQTVEYTYIEIK